MKQRIPAAATASRPAPSPARRQRLLEAAERLFSIVGYRAVTIAAIATEAGFAKATVDMPKSKAAFGALRRGAWGRPYGSRLAVGSSSILARSR